MKKFLAAIVIVILASAVGSVLADALIRLPERAKPLFSEDGSYSEEAFAYNLALYKNKGLTLFKNGKTAYTIIHSEKATQRELAAVQGLSDALYEMSGITFPIKPDTEPEQRYEICVGRTNRDFALSAPLKDISAYCVASRQKKLFLYGETEYGASNAVYGFLEDYLGCMYLAPGETYYPSVKIAVLPQMEDIQEPQFEIRDLYSYNTIHYADFRIKLRLSGQEVFDPDGAHKSLEYISPEVYFDEHPEYFALIDGERRSGSYMFQETQLCWSNPDVIRLLKEYFGKVAANYRASGNQRIIYWDISIEDSAHYCQCDNCAALRKSAGSGIGPVLLAVNEVARTYPDFYFSTLAYHEGSPAPVTIIPEKNVLIKYCFMSEYGKNDLAKPLKEAKSEIGKRHYKEIIEWSKLTDNIYVWDYVTDYFHYQMPFPCFQSLQGNYQLLAESNVKAVFSLSAYTQRGSSDTMKDYLLAKLLWNPYCDYEALMNKYLTVYYGKAYTAMRTYYNEIEKRLRGILWVYDFPSMHSKDYLSEESLTLYRSLWNEAFRAVKGDETYEKRLRYDKISLLYVTLISGYDKENTEKNKNELYALCDEFGIRALSEVGLTLKDYFGE